MTSPDGTTRTGPSPPATRPKVLFVDDDPRILAGLRRQLHRRYEVFTAEGGSQGLAILAEEGSFAVVVSDMRMPGMDGAAFLARVRTASPQATRVLLTGQTELSASIRAITDGQIFRFLNKPCPPEALDKCLEEAVIRHEATRDEYRLLASVLGDRRVMESNGIDEALAVGLQDGLANREFRLQYQPIIDLADDRAVAVEALVRWAHPDGSLVQAASFLPAAEASGMILPLGRWVMAAACQEIASWPALAGDKALRVHVNISERQLRDPQLVDDFAGTLLLSGLEPHRVILEIDEGPALQEPLPIRSLNVLAVRGIHLALAAFADKAILPKLLERLPFDMIKISKHLTALLATDPNVSLICRSIVEAAGHLRLRTVAEGIEGPEQQNACRALGFDLAQGYLYGRPADPGALLTRLARDGNARSAP